MKPMRSFFIILVFLAFLSGLYVYSNQTLDIDLLYAKAALKPQSNPTDIIGKEGLQNLEEKSAKCPNVLIKNGNYLMLYNSTDTHNEMPVMFNNLDEYANYIDAQRKKGINCPVLYLQKESDAQGNDLYRFQSNPYTNPNPSTPYNDQYNEPFSDFIGQTIETDNSGVLKFPPALKISPDSIRPKQTYPFYNIETFEGGMGTPDQFSPGTVPAPASALPQQSNTPPKAPSSSTKDVPSDGVYTPSQFNKGGYPGFDAYGLSVGKYTDLDKLHESTATTAPLSDNPMDPNWGGINYTKAAVDSGKYIENSVYSANYSMPGMVQFYPGLYQTYPDPPNYVVRKP